MQRWLVALLTVMAQDAGTQNLPPIRRLGPVVAVSVDTLGDVYTVRPLPGGRFIANDVSKRRLVLFDSTLRIVAVVADSSGPNSYGPRSGGLIAFRGDSSLFIEQASMLVLVIDPAGAVARVMAAPKASDVGIMTGSLGFPAFDAGGRLVYRNAPRFGIRTSDATPATTRANADTAAVLRIDFATRAVDTIAKLRIPKVRMITTQTERGFSSRAEVNPLPIMDDWAVLPDGSIALVRSQDFHVDWLDNGGRLTSSPKIPFEWRRLSDEDKLAFLDSVKAALERGRANAPADPARGSSAPPPFISASELPDYVPAFMQNATRSDVVGNLWVRTTSIVQCGAVYYVINRQGVVTDRVCVPPNRTIVGFGSGEAVYLFSREPGAVRLERARVR